MVAKAPVCGRCRLQIGYNSPVELMNYVGAIENALSKKADLEILPQQPGDVPDTSADVTDLVEQFYFEPPTPVENGVAALVAWYRDYF